MLLVLWREAHYREEKREMNDCLGEEKEVGSDCGHKI